MNKRIKHILRLFIFHIGKILTKPLEKWLRAKNIFLNINTAKKFKTCGTKFLCSASLLPLVRVIHGNW